MSSLSAKDRVSLCSFTFSDGRRCRTPRTGNNPRFCFYHAQKEARARAAQKLGKDLDYFFSGDYLSACDLSAALARLIPAVVRGAPDDSAVKTPQPPPPPFRSPFRGGGSSLSGHNVARPATNPSPTTFPIAADFLASHGRRIRSACSGRSSDRWGAGSTTRPGHTTSPSPDPLANPNSSPSNSSRRPISNFSPGSTNTRFPLHTLFPRLSSCA